MSGKKKSHPEKVLPKETVGVSNSLPWLFGGTLFLSATLLFLVELLMAKMILPLLGGSPSVWNTCMVFYQAALLAGYAYAHASAAWLSLRHQLLLHMALVVVPVVALPLGVTEHWAQGPPDANSPVIWLLALLLVSVGLPFFILSASTPLLQKWFSSTDHPAAKDPYFLYAASNLGSILALLGYPTVIEPLLPVKKNPVLSQCGLWTVGYGLLIVLVICCAWAIGKSLDREEKPRRTDPDVGEMPDSSPRLGILTRLRWIALAFVPSSLMLGVTAYISMDLAAIPLLWVIPLALYLLSFILVFAKWPERLHQALILALPPLVLILVFQMQGEMMPRIGLVILLHLVVLFLVALVCHGELALSRPAPRYLTEFYLWLSVGGVLGGFFNALLAPVIFYGIAEYQVGLVLACLLLPRCDTGNLPWLARWFPAKLAKLSSFIGDVVLASLVGFVSYRLFQFFISKDLDYAWLSHVRDTLRANYFLKAGKPFGLEAVHVTKILVFGLPLLLCYALGARPFQLLAALVRSLRGFAPQREPLINYLFVRRPLLFGLGVGTFMINCLVWLHISRQEPILYQTRNFYGVLKISSGTVSGIPQLRLTNGTTSHGAQWYHRDPDTMAGYFAPAIGLWPAPIALDLAIRYMIWAESDREPLTYYHRTGPIGQLFEEFSGSKAKKDIAVIGLGSGTLASYGEPGQTFLFFDIDPAVEQVAGTFFTYLAICRAKWGIISGDARIRMNGADDGQFQLIIVDAFNSDAIPVHLLTREAIQLYFQKLSKDGIVALHISNRYLKLEPVLGNLAQNLHLAGLAQYDTDVAGKPGKQASQWVLLANRREDFGKLALDGLRWKPIQSQPDVGVWTDDYSNLLGVFKWN